MQLSDNDLRFLKKVAHENPGNVEFQDLTITKPEDREAFRKLKPLGLIHGAETADGVMASLTADGDQALRDARPAATAKRYALRKVDLVINQSLSHLVAFLVGGAIGWLASLLFS
ncbi:hypothetical protein GQE99_14395 [Maritimibacter sp. DP07]|uniref:Uncharacterized protein n=1 Tax=Maritimibacter harenae TaxID=2606218 RepID=A0A845M5B6_9RHOB|nr:hypothetical protein [Maritimibacter harenae]MZR14209.1 hypothetical protein [Maritimibacter harenae]